MRTNIQFIRSHHNDKHNAKRSESMSVSVNKNGHRGSSIDLPVMIQWQPDMNNSNTDRQGFYF